MVAKLGKNAYVGVEMLEKTGNALHCAVEDVVQGIMVRAEEPSPSSNPSSTCSIPCDIV